MPSDRRQHWLIGHDDVEFFVRNATRYHPKRADRSDV
jgi:hypothetical protein